MIRMLATLGLSAYASIAGAQSLSERFGALDAGTWLSYQVPMQPGVHAPCCLDWNGRDPRDAVCRLDRKDWNFGHRDGDPVAEAGSMLRVLLRRDADGFDRVHAVGEDCAVDPAGQRLMEAGTIDAAQSIALLREAFGGTSGRRSQALAAVAHHAGADADAALEAASASGQREDLRRDAIFWSAEARGERGYRHVRAFLDGEADDDLRRHAVFALSISDVPAAMGELRTLAKRHADEGVRAQAVFWLAQNDDPETEAIVRDMLARESSNEVREQAIFALSQLPSERAVPALRALIERGDDRRVRKQALFWLAQVDDDAVLPVFDELLGGSTR